ncbi:MAG TPA: hypothetical protein VGM77_04495 [Gemmatimonadales bacterium]|jgi:hypothetical protein
MPHPLQQLLSWFDRIGFRPATTRHDVRGFRVSVDNPRRDIRTLDILERLDGALALIDQYTPHYARHMRRDFAGIVVRRFPCRGAFFPDSRLCLVELTFTVNRDFTLAQVAATILHEGMHARLHAVGVALTDDDRARQERFCRRGEIEFGRLVPGGSVVIARAESSLEGSDEEVAPAIDWQLAAERIREADRGK